MLHLPALKPRYWAALAGLVLVGGVLLVPSRATFPPTPHFDTANEVCMVAPPTPYDPKLGVDLHEPRPVPADARCPVCGMFPARSPDWAAQVIFDNGDTQFFDSPLSLFIYLQDVGRYTRGRQANEIAASFVKDVSSGDWINAHDAIYVNGSTAMGPMRAGNLPAFLSVAAAQAFTAKNSGVLLNAQQISPKLLQTLSAKRSHTHTQQSG